MNFYISDLHFFHKNILLYDSRPFASVEDMNAEMVRRWNSVVKNNDTVYVLGDMFFKNRPTDEIISILNELNGKKGLIKGNHDEWLSEDNKKYFDGIYNYLEVTDNGKNIVLSHYPILSYNGSFEGGYEFYGHVHISKDADLVERAKDIFSEEYGNLYRMINVGAPMPYMNYTPRTFEEIVSGYEKWKKDSKK